MALYYVLLFILAGLDLSSSGCPDNWVTFQGQCYLFSHDPKSFIDAENFCLQRGAHLAHINSKMENLFLENMCHDLVSTGHWIGLTDVDIEGIWKWKHSNQIANFTDWYPGEPRGGSRDNCVVIWPTHNFHWGDIACIIRVQARYVKSRKFLTARLKTPSLDNLHNAPTYFVSCANMPHTEGSWNKNCGQQVLQSRS